MKDHHKTKEQIKNELIKTPQQVACLEALETECRRLEEVLRNDEKKYRELADLLPQTVFEIDELGRFSFANRHGFEVSGYTQEDIDKGLNALSLFIPEDRERARENIRRILSGEKSGGSEYTAQRKDGSTFPIIIYSSAIVRGNKPVGLRGIVIDITERKRAEEELKKREKELELQAANLEEANTALKVLLKRREEDRAELEERILANVRELVEPFLKKLEKSRLDEKQKCYLDIVESNLKNIISPFLRKLSSKYLNLTPAELQVASLVKGGKTSKEIAELMNVSSKTVEFHRNNIRRKLAIKHKKMNLRSYLFSLE